MTPRDITKIIIHCSDSPFGDAEEIRRWHTLPKPEGRGWSDIGYHFVILNGRRKAGNDYDPTCDGIVEKGRPMTTPGAHCRGHNKSSIGICVVGRRWFTARQLVVALPLLIKDLLNEFPAVIRILGHRQLNPSKSCPNIDIPVFLSALNISF